MTVEPKATAIVYLVKVTDSEKRGRRAGDPLNCECSVCSAVRGSAEYVRFRQDVGNGVSLLVIENSSKRPKDRSRERRPNLEHPGSILDVAEGSGNSVPGRINHQKHDMPDTKERRLYITSLISWAGYG